MYMRLMLEDEHEETAAENEGTRLMCAWFDRQVIEEEESGFSRYPAWRLVRGNL